MRSRTMMGALVLVGSMGLLGCDSGQPGGSGLAEVDETALSLDPQATCNHDTRTEFYAPGPSDGSMAQVTLLCHLTRVVAELRA
jgi:hypothetical protein